MAEIRHCESCGRPINVPAYALNKRFCSDACRNSWHNKRTAKAKELLAETEAKEAGEQL